MDIIQSIVLGIIEGITEFLPISSTGHLILFSKVLGIKSSEFLKTYEISIQLGAILAVVVLYWRKLFIEREIIKRIIVAFLPTAVLGLLFYKIIKTYLLESALVVVISLFVGGIFLIVFELWYEKKKRKKVGVEEMNTSEELSKLSYGKSACIGLFQSIAMIPGVSRSAATIVGGLFLGLSRKAIVEFSFLLAVPTMAAATALDLYKNASSFNTQQFWVLLVGFVVSFVVAIVSIKFLLAFIKRYSFIGFGVYRMVIAMLFYLLII